MVLFCCQPPKRNVLPLMDHGAACGETVVIFVDARGGAADGIGGIEEIILEIVVGLAVPIVGSGFGDHLDLAVGFDAVLGGDIRSENVEFLHHVRLGLCAEGEAAEFPIVGVGEVEFDVGVFGAAAVGADEAGLRAADFYKATAAAGRVHRERRRGRGRRGR